MTARHRPRAPSAATIGETLRAAGADDVALHLFDELPSTQRWLEAHAGRSDEARALCAVDLQSAGLARRGRGWVSTRGNVACSLLERLPLEPARLGGLSLVTGIAVARELRERGGVDVQVKWPNDLLVDGAKLVGLLTTVQACPARARTADAVGGGPCSVVLSGIGVNVVHDARITGLGIGGTSLETLGVAAVDRDALIGRIAACVLDAHARFVREGWAAFADAWRSLDWLAGREIEFVGRSGAEQGRALGVDADGALRVRVGGTERLLYGGEVSVRSRGTPALAGEGSRCGEDEIMNGSGT